MQQFTDIPSTETLVNSRQKLIDNDKTIMSCHAGTTAPTTNLVVGMLFLNTSTWQLFQLKSLTPDWKLIFDLSKTAVSQEYVDTGLSGKVDKTSSARPGVTKLYRKDNDSAYNVQVEWDNTYWYLKGYNGDTYHAGVRVARADSVDWSGVQNKPSTFAPPVATASVLGGVKQGSGCSIAADGTLTINFPAGFSLSNTITVTGSNQGDSYECVTWQVSTSNKVSNNVSWGGTTVPAEFQPIEGIDGSWPASQQVYYWQVRQYRRTGVAGGTYTLQSLLQELVSKSHTHAHRENRYYWNCDCTCSDNCLVRGVRVLMANGSYKAAELVEIGEKIIGRNGVVNTVIAKKFSTLGDDRVVMTMANNRKLRFTGEHMLWVKQDDIEGWGTHNINDYLKINKGFVVDGIEYSYDLVEFGQDIPLILQRGESYLTENGFVIDTAVVAREYGSDTETVTLAVDGDGSCIAEGYVVQCAVRKGGA